MTLLTEIWDAARLAGIGDGRGAAAARRAGRDAAGGAPAAGGGAQRLGRRSRPGVVQGWMVEPVRQRAGALWIWGAGHVGRALVAVLAPLPDFAITWVDTAAGALSRDRSPRASRSAAPPIPAALARHAPGAGRASDPDLFPRARPRPLPPAAGSTASAGRGLIGSATKWARFRSRLRQLGHADAAISRICCPIGRKSAGQTPAGHCRRRRRRRYSRARRQRPSAKDGPGDGDSCCWRSRG